MPSPTAPPPPTPMPPPSTKHPKPTIVMFLVKRQKKLSSKAPPKPKATPKIIATPQPTTTPKPKALAKGPSTCPYKPKAPSLAIRIPSSPEASPPHLPNPSIPPTNPIPPLAITHATPSTSTASSSVIPMTIEEFQYKLDETRKAQDLAIKNHTAISLSFPKMADKSYLDRV